MGDARQPINISSFLLRLGPRSNRASSFARRSSRWPALLLVLKSSLPLPVRRTARIAASGRRVGPTGSHLFEDWPNFGYRRFWLFVWCGRRTRWFRLNAVGPVSKVFGGHSDRQRLVHAEVQHALVGMLGILNDV